MKLDKPNQRELLLWATDCAEHVLTYFEAQYPDDDRPRRAIEAPRAWLARGEVAFSEVRAVSLDAHAAARAAGKATAARAAARAAGQAAATAHVPGHAWGAAAYAVAAARAAGTSIDRERAWQRRRLPKHLRSVALLGSIDVRE
jgi:hypothetical protein